MTNDKRYKKSVKGHNYNSHHCGDYKRKNTMCSSKSISKCEDNFYHQNGIKDHWTCECYRPNRLTSL